MAGEPRKYCSQSFYTIRAKVPKSVFTSVINMHILLIKYYNINNIEEDVNR